MRSGIIGATLAAVMIPATAPIRAVEKYWIIHDADLVVVGTILDPHEYVWFDGIHISGMIDVQEILLGNAASRQVSYHFFAPCDWFGHKGVQCDLRAIVQNLYVHPVLPDRMTGLWFLRHGKDGSWAPTVELGFAGLDERPDYEAALRRLKH